MESGDGYDKIFNAIKRFALGNRGSLDFLDADMREAKYIELSDVYFKTAQNIQIKDDTVTFHALIEAEFTAQKKWHGDYEDISDTVWFRLDCEMTVTDKMDGFRVKNIEPYSRKLFEARTAFTATDNFVPVLSREDLDGEAERFLEEYYPEALKKPIPVPMREVIEKRMGLKVHGDIALTRDLSFFGMICFADGDIIIYDEATKRKKPYHAERGEIFVDPNVYFLRCLGCKHNTMAHEAYHWYKHRVYATVKNINTKAQTVAHRCPTAPRGNKISNTQPTDEEWMEWQANAVAPRILMPRAQTEIKVKQLLKEHGYIERTPDSLQIIQDVIDELSEYYQVSKQAAKIRLINFGYHEAAEVYNYETPDCLCPSKEATTADAFAEYQNNKDFKFLFDEELFRNVEGRYVINTDKYRIRNADGDYVLTEYAKENLDECAITFEYNILEIFELNRKRGVMYKAEGKAHREPRIPKIFYPEHNEELSLRALEEVSAAKAEFEKVLALGDETVAETLKRYMEIAKPKWNSTTFFTRTGLNPQEFRKINTKPNKKFELPAIVSICVGLDLPQGASLQIIEKAGFKLNPAILEGSAYLYILSPAIPKNIPACNEFLEALSETFKDHPVRLLGSKFYDGSGEE
jgi:hypothetical protein